MSIAFFTEGGYTGKIPRNNPNMRTDQAWMCALDATHYCVFQLEQVTQKYDNPLFVPSHYDSVSFQGPHSQA